MPDTPEASDDAAPGWDAITAAFSALYPGQEPRHWGTILPAMLGGGDPIQGISAWKRLAPSPHWHFVTYGFSELYAKESDDPETSGYGFELTFRMACDPAEEEPPAWVFSLLQNLARYVFRTGNVFAAGHWMNANGPIALETDTEICSIAFADDPEVPAIDTVNGHVDFLQIVGLTIEEERAVKQWNAHGVLAALLPHMPLWVTDLARGSLLDLPDVAQRIAEGAAAEGSSTGIIYTDTLDWTVRKRLFRAPVTEIVIGANQVADIAALLPLRLRFGNMLTIFCQPNGKLLEICPATADDAEEDGNTMRLSLSPASVEALPVTLQARTGSYAMPGTDHVAWRVEQSQIRDRDGKLVRTVG